MVLVSTNYEESDWDIPVYGAKQEYTCCYACGKMNVFCTDDGAPLFCDFCEDELTDSQKEYYEANPVDEEV